MLNGGNTGWSIDVQHPAEWQVQAVCLRLNHKFVESIALTVFVGSINWIPRHSSWYEIRSNVYIYNVDNDFIYPRTFFILMIICGYRRRTAISSVVDDQCQVKWCAKFDVQSKWLPYWTAETNLKPAERSKFIYTFWNRLIILDSDKLLNTTLVIDITWQ